MYLPLAIPLSGKYMLNLHFPVQVGIWITSALEGRNIELYSLNPVLPRSVITAIVTSIPIYISSSILIGHKNLTKSERHKKQEQERDKNKNKNANNRTQDANKNETRWIRTNTEAVKQGPSTGKAAIEGPFRVINHHGKHVTEKDFMGKWTLLYFGFTHCPNICPEELQKLAAAVDKIKEKAGIETVPVFISIDPERDIVEQVGEYVKEFHPKLIGLTGSPDEVKNVARAYRVYC
ncbi:Protein SCO1-like 1, mitochondrial [Glycine soja]|uniref:Protein SCO1-like 1, mitochondrial n=1 Tax=Glycine soja TaxID=3848 RepID=A0A445GGM2_GLYSO|nr:Protein SCO1-like 1, mitochondrial [Glycine soja]